MVSFLKRSLLICWIVFRGSLPAPAAETGAFYFPQWNSYKTIMWIGDTAYKRPEKLPLFLQRLREMGINTAMVHHEGTPDVFTENQFPYYVENMVNRGLCLKFSSKVTDWDKFVTDWAKNGRPVSALIRDYCLDDPAWNSWAQKEMQQLALKHRANHPLAYNIRDELSTTISANPFDYDFNPVTLASFRIWLRSQYSTLERLNKQWDTGFESWDQVIPFTTDQIKQRMVSGASMPKGSVDWSAVAAIKFQPVYAAKHSTNWNFSPWADFRTYMDISLARALENLRKAAREVDPETPVGVEGTQMPSAWGGYDLWRLSQSLDWIEPYDIGSAREILGSFMTGKPIMTTVFESDTLHAQRRLWHLLLEGDRGCLIWWSEDCIDWKSDDYNLTPKAKALAPVLNEMSSPLAALFLKARREFDPISIVYSHPSIQADWLLESTVDGSTWLRRFSSFEADHNHLAKLRNGWLKGLQDVGFSPRFISSEQLEKKDFAQTRVMVFPSALALSDKELESIASFLKNSTNRIFADNSLALFDQHGKFRISPFRPLSTNIMNSYVLPATLQAKEYASDIAAYAAERQKPGPSSFPAWLGESLTGIHRFVSIPIESHTMVHRYSLKSATLLAFERNIDYHMSEDLKQAGGNESLEKPLQLNAQLLKPYHVYDLSSGRYLGSIKEI
ncbi:MAG: Beta-galactosidase, partial [Verrucomicrobiales bacterium]|nr:Beta-galactosidase [Verrucomicrobiales bacterium]